MLHSNKLSSLRLCITGNIYNIADERILNINRINSLYCIAMSKLSGITSGTFAGFALFIYGGNYIVLKAANNQQLINWIVGIILLITALVQLYKMIWKPVAAKVNVV